MFKRYTLDIAGKVSNTKGWNTVAWATVKFI